MIVVWNSARGDMYGFKDLAAYREFARTHEGDERTCWEDYVYDVAEGGKASEPMDLHAMKCEITDTI